MNLEIWYDLVCPWCYLGKRRLEAVLLDFPGDVSMTFRAYQLDPEPVGAPLPLERAMIAKVGDPRRVGQMLAHVTTVVRGAGLPLEYNRAVAANTFDAHRLVAWAAAQELQLTMIETLQRAHFADGADLGSHAQLARLAGEIGLDERAALAYLAGPAGTDAVNADLAEARELGITSVPTFVVDRRYVVQGAQEPAALRSALEEIARREAVDATR
ncbi:DsbA family oxidoreductase [Amorphoplanes nipponensis]|uniref:DSBA oxidoreductase n=1 Tax=Actinoplanes nipponensis TaxID=135950 RepID=A0A919JG15_9ACTN|nr:DsbA family oxidoreductase [Actinoplanes nipponensis]GIE49796.1 DSBA oxidoreductase [Actinoplanes nipponensis]